MLNLLRHWSRAQAAVLLALVGGVCWMPRDGLASCGDYLVFHPRGLSAEQLEIIATNYRSALRQRDMAAHPVGTSPCNSPNCRERKSTPPLPVPPVPPERSTQATLQAFRDLDLERKASSLADFCSLLLPDGFPFRLERPPRA